MKFFIFFLASIAILSFFLKQQLDNIDIEALNKCVYTKMNKVPLCKDLDSYTPFKLIPDHFIQTLIVSEDIQFFKHAGFEWDEIKNSALKNIKALKFKRGGSTITQQLVKNVFLSREKSITRKLREAYLTHRIEDKFSKEFILEKYVNIIELGPNLFGIKNASLHYFGVAPENLKQWQSIFLVYLLPNPKVYSQIYDKKELTEFSQTRMLDIAKKLYAFNKISEEKLQQLEQRITGPTFFENLENEPASSTQLDIPSQDLTR